MVIGHIDKSVPKANVSPMTKRIANYVSDIQGSAPKKMGSITDHQREAASGKNSFISNSKIGNSPYTRNTIEPEPQKMYYPTQDEMIR